MQELLQGFNPQERPDFVSIYLDDVLTFSETLDEHQEHPESVISNVEEVRIELKLSKCQFVWQEVEYEVEQVEAHRCCQAIPKF